MHNTIILEFDNRSWEPHPKYSGLYVKHFLSGEENYGFRIFWVKVTPGHEVPIHTHEITEVYLIWEGKGEMEINGEVKMFSKGTIFASPAGVEHGMKNAGDEDLIILANFTHS